MTNREVINIKNKIIFDFDGVIVNIIRTICDLYNDDFRAYNKFKYIDWHEVNTWDFTELNCTTPEYVNTYFNQPRFFDNIKFMPLAELKINSLCRNFDVTIVSAGYLPNLRLKEEYINRWFPNVRFIGVNMKEYKDKSHIDMSDAVFVDDSANNLATSNAQRKICFGRVYPWNENWTGERCADWSELYTMLMGGE